MKKAIVSLLLLFILLGCKENVNTSNTLIDYIPEKTAFIIRVNQTASLSSSLKNNSFLKKIENTSLYQKLEKQLHLLKYTETSSPFLLCFTEVGVNNFEFTLIARKDEFTFDLEAIADRKIESFTYEDVPITKVTIADQITYQIASQNFLILSSSELLIENTIRKDELKNDTQNKSLEKAYQTCSESSTTSLLINVEYAYDFFKDIFSENFPQRLQKASSWMALDINSTQDQIIMGGISLSEDDSNTLVDLFNQNNAQPNKLSEITPISADGFISFTYDDLLLLRDNISKYNGKADIPLKDSSLFSATNEIGIIFNNTKKCVALHYIDGSSLQSEIENEKNIVNEYRGVPIYKYSDFKILVTTFSPLIENSAANFYTILDNFLIFSDQIENLHAIISNYQNKSTLASSDSFKEITSELNEASSILMVSNNSNFKDITAAALNQKFKNDNTFIFQKGYSHFVMQFISDKKFAHMNAVINKSSGKRTSGSVAQLLNIALDNDIYGTPQFVVNHRTKQKEILAQDIDQNLYLISGKGKVLWKKKINGLIQGKVDQVDLYKNGKLQLAFVTDKTLYVIDRNGDKVAPFPLIFDKTISQPLALFDYDKTKNYRFLLCFGKTVEMYDGNAKKVNGFSFKKTETQIINTPKHIREKGKDYIIIQDEQKLYVLDRRGNTRVRIKENIAFSENEVFIYKNTFSTTTKKGELIKITPNGNVTKQNLNLDENHKIYATAKSLVSISNNILDIKGKKIEMDFGFYTAPKIFYINDKIYVTTTDTQANKVYMFDSNGIAIPGFPVYGIAPIDMADIDNDKNIELVVQGEKKSILVYTIN